MELIEKALREAKEVLQKCSTSHGMHASAGEHGYNMIFSRDSMIALMGASAADGDAEFKQQFGLTLSMLAKYQSNSGQIPNAIDLWDYERRKQVTFATIDSTLWYLLGLKAYERNYNDKKVIKQYKNSIDKAFCWLRCQDAGEDHMPEQLPTSDWEDCFPHKYGHTVNTVALYHACLNAYGKGKEARTVKRVAHGLSDKKIEMFSNKRGYFLPWVWKNHDGNIEREYWFDSLGNALAVLTGLASRAEAESILEFIEREKINRPFPLKAIYPPIKEGSGEWHSYFSKCLAGKPNWYINGGIWPYIGGIYIAALVKVGQLGKAEHELLLLAKANRLGKEHSWEFNEWIHPIKRKAMGSPHHAWSAGAFLLAFTSLVQKQLPFPG